MGLGKVYDVDEVAQAGAVGGGIVVAEDIQAGTFPHCGLGDEGHQVVGDAARQFADQGAGMCADGVEVPQQDALDCTAAGLHRVAEDILAHLLGVAVRGGGGLAGCLFGNRHGIRLSVDCGR